MPRTMASHSLRRISQGEPRARRRGAIQIPVTVCGALPSRRYVRPFSMRNSDRGFYFTKAGFEQRGSDFFKVNFRHDAEPFFKPHGWWRADGLHVGGGFGVEKRQMAERHFEFAPAILPGDGNVDDQRARGVEMVGDENDGGGWVRRPCPCPPARLRRGAGSFAVEDVQFFLLDFARGQHVGPIFPCALAFEESQVMQDLAHHRFGLMLNFFDQHFLRAYGYIIRQNMFLASHIAPVFHPKMNSRQDGLKFHEQPGRSAHAVSGQRGEIAR